MASEDLLVTLGVQDKGAKQQITALNKEIRYLDKEFKTVTTTSKQYETGTASLQRQQELLNQKMEAVKGKLSAYNKQMLEAKEGIASKKAELERLNNTEGDNEKAIERVTNQLNKYEQQLRDAERNIDSTERELQQLGQRFLEVQGNIQTKHLQDYAHKLQEMSERMEETANRFRSFGDGLNNVGNNLIALGSPIMALSGYASKVSIDFESAMSEVQATSGAAGKDLELLTEKAKEMGAKTSKSATDSAKALQYMSLAGWDTTQMLTGLEPILRMSELANADLGRTSDLVTDSMSSLGVKVEDLSGYLDIVAKTQSKANTSALDLMDAYIGCGGILKEFKTPLEESATLLGTLANRGIKGAEAGASLNSVLINLMGVGGQASEGLKALGVSAYDTDGSFRGVTVTLRDLKEKLATCTDQQRQQFEAMIGGKTQIDTLSALLSGLDEEYTDLYSSVSNADGSLLSMAETMQDNTKGNIEKLKSQLEGLGIQLGQHLLPHINDLIGYLSKVMEWFGNLEEGTQKNILKFGLMATASGVLLKGLGSLSKGIGNTISVFSKVTGSASTFITKFADASIQTGLFDKSIRKVGLKTFGTTLATTGSQVGGVTGAVAKLTGGFLSLNPVTIGITTAVGVLATGLAVYKTNQDLANSSCIRAKEDLSLFDKTVALFTGRTFESTEALKEKGLVLDSLSESFSDDFKTAVDDATKGSNEFSLALKSVNLDGVFSQEESSELIGRVDNLVTGTISTINARNEEQQKAFSELFAVDNTIDENEAKILEHYNNVATKSVEEVTKLKAEIIAIQQTAVDEKRGLNDQEIADIETKEQRIREIQLQNLATTNEEMIFAKNDFKNRVATMDAETASEYLQKQSEYAEEQKLQKSAQYDTAIEMLRGNLETMDSETRASAETTIANLEQDKANELATWDKYFADCLGIAISENANLEGILDTSNGNILTNQGKKSAEMLKDHIGYYKDLGGITETGLYSLYSETDKTFRDVFVNVDSSTGKITGTYDTFYGTMGGINENIAKDTKNMSKEYDQAQKDMSNRVKATTNDFKVSGRDMLDSNGKVVGSMEKLTKETDGTFKAIGQVNGKPIKITSNSTTARNEIEEVATSIKNLPSSKTVTINVKQNGSASGRSIEYGGQGYSLVSQSVMADIPSMRSMPTEYGTMATDSSFYSNANPVIRTIAEKVAPVEFSSNTLNIDYAKLGEIVALAVAKAVASIKVEPTIINAIDGQELYSSVSNEMAYNMRGRR